MLAGRPDPSDNLGALAAQLGEQPLDLWEEHVAVVSLFADMMTQWSIGPGGAVGLRYEALPVLFDLRGTPPAERAGLFDGLRVMERAALEEFRRG